MMIIMMIIRYETYAQPFQQGYDNIVQSSLGLLRGFTLDDRATDLRDQYRTLMVSYLTYNI
jgi:hypothetical protein